MDFVFWVCLVFSISNLEFYEVIMKLSDRIKLVKPSVTLAVTAKAKALKAKGVNVISFAAGEPDFDTPTFVKTAAKAAIDSGKTKYTPSIGTLALREAVCKELSSIQGLKYKPEQIIVSSGAKHSLYNIFQAICGKDDEVIIPSPYWVSYPEMVRLASGKPVFVDTKASDGFKLNIETLESKINKNTKAIILNSPSNPTGAVYDEETLRQIAELALKNQIIVISDEIYKTLLYNGKKHVSIASLGDDIKKLTIVVDGVSKAYSMTGWRIGYLASDMQEIVGGIKNIQSHSTSNPSSISQEAAFCALTSKESAKAIEDMRSEFESRRDYMVENLNKIPGLTCIKPEGAFYCFCDISKTKMDSLTFANQILDKESVAVIPGVAFGWPTHIRLSFATGIDDIEEGIKRIGKFINE